MLGTNAVPMGTGPASVGIQSSVPRSSAMNPSNDIVRCQIVRPRESPSVMTAPKGSTSESAPQDHDLVQTQVVRASVPAHDLEVARLGYRLRTD